MRSSLGLLPALALACACGTVDPGDNFVTPEPRIDEGFFFCRVQPEVIGPSSCASGGPGEGGECHADRSALFLDPMAETVAPPECVEGEPVGEVPTSYQVNLEGLRLRVGPDPSSSPVYRRPLGLDSHPREIFEEGSPEAMLLVDWITMGAQ